VKFGKVKVALAFEIEVAMKAVLCWRKCYGQDNQNSI
jgi:hypothetical protein